MPSATEAKEKKEIKTEKDTANERRTWPRGRVQEQMPISYD